MRSAKPSSDPSFALVPALHNPKAVVNRFLVLQAWL